ncbi:bifunctional ornithine acetyltransferase/N-acetylglutamate synthase [Heyndrickxia sp. FSL K6-6286]|uniref:Arginine biosynthesis bifunctional protein ArgJ n=1 Tax=Heyndrickxia oleronia TaxID=38875 RepID=A0AAW6SYU7_9BACI|nr:bifunctional ornithine acetyltransferase/N-acetylglutamate synthase [Heyndrickxia oleronia]MDH5162630.1 bifunctional ornithine acetyltransferase/N-acetylglutamate synthase [Heyndrickxia oleronia]
MNSIEQIINEEIQVVENGSITTPAGFFAGGLHCGIKRKKLDLGWLYSVVPATAACVYTTNQFQAPPLIVTKEGIEKSHKIQGVIVNSGIANACTGNQGLSNAYEMRKLFAEQMNIQEYLVAVSSTGVIGEQLPMEKIKSGISEIDDIKRQNDPSEFEKAILTTDTFSKHVCIQLHIDGKTVTIGGTAKGSGMIHPNMATMLGFITTDAVVKEADLQIALKQVVDKTFNMITVDGDTSTNDMVLLLANQQASHQELSIKHPQWQLFMEGLEMVCRSLAKQIAKDGEGATKLIEVQVQGASSCEDAKKVAKSIIGSNLVKTAIFGEDPNWGRIIAAIGYSGAQLNPEHLKVSLGPFTVIEQGLPFPFSEAEAKLYLQQNEVIQIFADLYGGEGKATAWGCDLTYDYVKINASYRT